MIDWVNLFFNSLWIVALSIALATVSYHNWQASEKKTGTWAELQGIGAQKALSAAGVLFSAGLAGTSEAIWEIGLWIVLGLVFAGLLVRMMSSRQEA
jgi:hypothetical protein